MSILGIERSSTVHDDIYDHAIDLVDATKTPGQAEQTIDDPVSSTSLTDPTIAQPVTRQLTRTHLRKQLAQRKYAKWQEDKESGASDTETSVNGDGNAQKLSKTDTFRSGRIRDKLIPRNKKQSPKKPHGNPTFVDVLYENQRGWWLCGIPLYSSNSLLQIDPAAWQSSTFHDSPVNITNAQVPDPSWEWAWRRWYVDMSYDVDEEGWQYSFSFARQFAWHGSHPWFHSYVRRRRWLRKRVKKGYQNREGVTMKEAHQLNPDYFTIHPTLRPSRDTSAERGKTHQSSFTEPYTATSDTDTDFEEVSNIAALIAALKRAIVDREKISAVRAFLDQGGDELYYLADRMPMILDDFVHQTSRRQLQYSLLQALETARSQQEQLKDDEDGSPEAKRRADNILKAIHAGGVHENDVEYWSDLHKRRGGNETGPTNERNDLDATQSASSAQDVEVVSVKTPDIGERGFREEIKGLPADDQLFEEPHIGMVGEGDDRWETEDHDPPTLLAGKGKGKA